MITPLASKPPVIEDFVIRSSSGDDNDNDGATIDDFGTGDDERRVGVAL
jgi:hypothetical protein